MTDTNNASLLGSIFSRWPKVTKSPFEVAMQKEFPSGWEDHVGNCDKQLNPAYVRQYLEPYFDSRVKINTLVSLWENDYKEAIERVKQSSPKDSSAINVTDSSDTTSSSERVFDAEDMNSPMQAPTILQFNYWLEQYMLRRLKWDSKVVRTVLNDIRGYNRQDAIQYLTGCGFSADDRVTVLRKQPPEWPYPNPAPHTEEGRAEAPKAPAEPSRTSELDHDVICENGFSVRLPKGFVSKLATFDGLIAKACQSVALNYLQFLDFLQTHNEDDARSLIARTSFSDHQKEQILYALPRPWPFPIKANKDLTVQAIVQAEDPKTERAPYALVYGSDKVLMCDPFEQAWVEAKPPIKPEEAMTLADDIMYLRNKKNVYAHVLDFMTRKAKVPREVLHNLMLTWLEVHPVESGQTDWGKKLEVLEDKDAFYARQATAEELEEERTQAVERIAALTDAICWAYAAMATARRNEITVARMDELPVEARPYLMQGQNVMTMAMREVEALLPKIAKDNG